MLGFWWLIISRVGSSKWYMQNFGIFTPWGILDHWLYFDGYCKVTSNSQNTSLELCVENYKKICSDNKNRLNTALASNWFYPILTHVNHFMYFHGYYGYCKVTSNSQYTLNRLCVANHQEMIPASLISWKLRLVDSYHLLVSIISSIFMVTVCNR